MKKTLFFLVLTLCCLLISGCSDKVSSLTNLAQGSIFKTEGMAGKLIEELKVQPELKGKEIKVFQNVVISEIQGAGTVIQINLLKPGTTDKVDNYTYRAGKWNGPTPVQISGDGAMEDNVLPIGAIDFTKISNIYKVAEKKATEIEGGKVDDILVYIMDYDKKSFYATININGAREKFVGKFDGQGNLLSMDKK